MKGTIEIFTELGVELASFGSDTTSRQAIANAIADNEWFCEDDIRYAVEAIRCDMLLHDALQQWLSLYPTPTAQPKRIAIIMAGNIPLVGFFDLLCVVASGNTPYIKYSSKDRVLMEYIVGLLHKIEPKLAIERYDDTLDYDAVIATGGDSANIYFRNRFKGVPCLLRSSRHSIAVLSGKESSKEIEGLGRDIFTYSGLGCRNVSLIFAPRGYRLELPKIAMCAPFRNNYIQHRAMLTMSGVEFEDSGEALFVRGEAKFPSKLSQVNIVEYHSIDEVEKWIQSNAERLQCIVSNLPLPHSVPFGYAQHPTLTDYADNKDTLTFLLHIM